MEINIKNRKNLNPRTGTVHPGVHPPAGHPAGFRQGGEEKPAVIVVMENRFTPVASRHHVVKGTGKFDTKTPWHAGRVEERGFLSRFAH